MQTLDRDDVSLRVDASTDVLYALVSDVTRTPEFSPEIVRCSWLDGAHGPAVGARFEAVNRTSGGRSWKNKPVVRVADPGREFAFARTEPFAGTIVWRYRFERDGSGTLITESYEVEKPVGRIGWFVIERIFRAGNRREVLRAGMQQTLVRIRDTAQRRSAAR
jgi:hypothetical protein